MYEMFMGPLEATKPGIRTEWKEFTVSLTAYGGCSLMRMAAECKIATATGSDAFNRTWHRTIKKVTEDYESLRFNTAISQMMIFVNEAYKAERLPRKAMEDFVQLLAPIAPHIGEELWERLGHSGTITYVPWPEYDEALTVDDEVEIVIQINGKIVERLMIDKNLSREEMEKQALALDKVEEAIAGKQVRKVIAVPQKLVNIVVG